MILAMGWGTVMLSLGFIAVRGMWLRRRDDPSQRVVRQVEQWRRVRLESASGQKTDSSNDIPA